MSKKTIILKNVRILIQVEFKTFKCDNGTFSDYVSIDEDMDLCEKLSDDDLVNTI